VGNDFKAYLTSYRGSKRGESHRKFQAWHLLGVVGDARLGILDAQWQHIRKTTLLRKLSVRQYLLETWSQLG
jgi:hypothetical protein